MANQVPLTIDGPRRAACAICLAHGAGAGSDTPFMNAFAEGLSAGGLRVVRFEFPYMVQRRASGKRRPPDREGVLRQTWLEAIGAVRRRFPKGRLVIGGKSMGGRIASLVADEAQVAGLVCLGYPFHPAGKPDRTRIDHLKRLATPTLIVQGERDALGNRQEVASYRLPRKILLHWLADGDHSFVPRKSSGRTGEENWHEAIAAVLKFARKCSLADQ